MLCIDCDHDPVNGLSSVSEALSEHWLSNRHTCNPYECVGCLCDTIRHYSYTPTLDTTSRTYFCQDANDEMRLVKVRFQP
jgi:thiamine biosynthesis protein ThiC